MGKYMKKGRIAGDMSVVEVPQSGGGVRTRAKTLALKQNPDVCYLQLRSRRLEKSQIPQDKINRCSTHQTQIRNSASILRVESVKSDPAGSDSFTNSKEGEVVFGKFGDAIQSEEVDYGTERRTWESTPCSLKGDLDSIGTHGSAVRSTCSASVKERRVRDLLQRSSPSKREMEDFFAPAESQQQEQFMDKYNFDVLNGLPLAGRYEWVRVDL